MLKSLKPNLAYQLFASFVFAVTPVLTFPYLSRTLGPEHIGEINFIDFTSQLFILIASFGIPLYGAREIAKHRSNKKKVAETAAELLSIHLVVTALCIFLFFFTLRFNKAIELQKELIFLATLNIAFNAFTFDWLISGLEDFKFLSQRALVTKTLLIISTFLFVRSSPDSTIYYTILVGNSILIIVIDISYMLKKKVPISLQTNIKKHLKPLSVFFITAAAVSAYTYLNTFLLGVLSGSLAVGFYTTALKIVKLSQNLVNDLSHVVMPRVAYLVELENANEIQRVIDKSLLFVSTTSIPLGLFFYMLAPEIIDITASQAFHPSICSLQILSGIPLIIGIGRVFGFQILIPFRKEKQMLLPVICGSIMCISLSLLLCAYMKENGAAIAYLVAETCVTIITGYYARKIISFTFPPKMLLSICCSSLLFIPIILVIRSLVVEQLYIVLLCFVLCGICFTLIQSIYSNNPVIKNILQFILSIVQKPK